MIHYPAECPAMFKQLLKLTQRPTDTQETGELAKAYHAARQTQ